MLSLSFTGNTGLLQRLQHARRRHRLDPRRSGGLRGAEQAAEPPAAPRQGQLGLGSAGLQDRQTRPARSSARSINDWQVSGLFTGGSGNRYDLGYSYNTGGGNVNLTGSPDYGARIVIVGDPGKGCSSNQFTQFNTAAVTGPTYNSVGLESGRNYMIGCPDHTTDLAIARNIRFGGGRASCSCGWTRYNAFNMAIITGRKTTAQLQQPDRPDAPQSAVRGERGRHDAGAWRDGTVLAAGRDLPRNAGFGAANALVDEPDQRQLHAVHPVHAPRAVLSGSFPRTRRAGGLLAHPLFSCTGMLPFAHSCTGEVGWWNVENGGAGGGGNDDGCRGARGIGTEIRPEDLAGKLTGTWILNRELSTGFRAPAGRRSGGALAPRPFFAAASMPQRGGGGRGGGGGYSDATDLTPEQRAEQAAMRQLQQIAARSRSRRRLIRSRSSMRAENAPSASTISRPRWTSAGRRSASSRSGTKTC